jgi:hypothetical protein
MATDPEVPGSILGVTKVSEKIVVLERGSLSLVKINEDLTERKNIGSGLENCFSMSWSRDVVSTAKSRKGRERAPAL